MRTPPSYTSLESYGSWRFNHIAPNTDHLTCKPSEFRWRSWTDFLDDPRLCHTYAGQHLQTPLTSSYIIYIENIKYSNFVDCSFKRFRARQAGGSEIPVGLMGFPCWADNHRFDHKLIHTFTAGGERIEFDRFSFLNFNFRTTILGLRKLDLKLVQVSMNQIHRFGSGLQKYFPHTYLLSDSTQHLFHSGSVNESVSLCFDVGLWCHQSGGWKRFPMPKFWLWCLH